VEFQNDVAPQLESGHDGDDAQERRIAGFQGKTRWIEEKRREK